MIKTAYLRNGEAVELHETLENGQFIIERMYVYSEYEGNECIEPCGVKEVVKEVFMKPPIEKKHDDLIKIIEKIETKNKELAELEKQIIAAKAELRESDKYKTDIEKHVINRSEILKAKSITVFSDFKPYTLTEDKEKRSLRLSYSLDIWEGKFNAWVCNLDWDGRECIRKSINLKYGLVFNATENEILEICKQIVKDEDEISDNYLRRTDLLPDAYLTDELKIKRAELLKKERLKDIEKQEQRIKEEQEKLRNLKFN